MAILAWASYFAVLNVLGVVAAVEVLKGLMRGEEERGKRGSARLEASGKGLRDTALKTVCHRQPEGLTMVRGDRRMARILLSGENRID